MVSSANQLTIQKVNNLCIESLVLFPSSRISTVLTSVEYDSDGEREIPWRKAWHPTPAFLPGESHGQRSLVCYSSQGCTEWNTTEVTQHAGTHGDRKTKELRVHSGAQAHFCHPKSPQTSTLPPTSVCASVEQHTCLHFLIAISRGEHAHLVYDSQE